MPASPQPDSPDPHPARESAAGRRLGAYRVIRTLGRGGMGTVYLAVRDDDVFEKRVAIKVLKRGMDTESIVRRFRHERQILATLDHPYIAGVLDGGTTPEGLPYFVMEYVDGEPITAYCGAHALDTTGRLHLFRKVCAAVQAAHQNLIIHRDIKPGNVLVTADGTPKLLDFGIAKLLNPDLAGQTIAPTVAGLQLMTPEYASPEQVRGDVVTTATDIYSLGVLLYELLTGRRPYLLTSRAPADIARVVCEAVPARPSTAVTGLPALTVFDDVATGEDASASPTRITGEPRGRSADTERLRRRLSGDLDNIVLKALSKEPSRRYASADQFAEDVHRHLAGLPVIARPDTLAYRTGKFVRRNRAAVAAGVLTFAALVAGIIGTTWQAHEAHRQRADAEQRFEDVRRLANFFLFTMHDAIQDLPGSTPARRMLVSEALAYLDKLSRDSGDRADLRRELATAYLKVGDVQGRPLNPNLGDTAGALASYRKAVELYEQLSMSEPSARAGETGGAADAGLARELAVAYARLGELLSVTGDTSGALAYARNALAMQSRLSAAAPAGAAGRELAASHSRVADLLSATGDVHGALDHRKAALAVMEGLVQREPADPSNVRQLGIAYQKLGQTLGNPNAPNLGDFDGALRAFERSSEVLREGIAAHPDSVVFRRMLAVVHSNTADVLSAQSRETEALDRQREALRTFESIAAADPSNAAAKADVAISQSKIGLMLDALGRTTDGLGELQHALALVQSLAAADPRNEGLKADLASSYNQIATLQVKRGARGPALASHDRAVAISRELSGSNPHDVELRVALALALGGRADAFAAFARRRPAGAARLADLQAAERDYAECTAIFAALTREGAIAGTDVESAAQNERQLQRVRADVAALQQPH